MWSEIGQQVLHKRTEELVHVGVNSMWNLLAVTVVKAESLDSLRTMSQTSLYIYICLPKAKPLAVHLQSVCQQQWGPGHWTSKTI